MLNNFDKAFESMLAQSKLILNKYSSHVSGNMIINFSYNELRENGDFIVLNSNEAFLQALIENDLCLNMPKSIINAHPNVGFYIFDTDSKATIENFKPFTSICQRFGYGHTFRFVKLSYDPEFGTVIKRFGFESDINNDNANFFYLNHLPVITRFFEEMDAYIKTLIGQVIPFASDLNPKQIRQYIYNNKLASVCPINIGNVASLQTGPTNLSEHTTLTRREIDVLDWLQKGKTAEETAIILGLSRRTVESHFAELRRKFNCRSKYLILKKLGSVGR